MFGGGQLGRMFTLAAKQMAYKVVVFSPESDAPAGQVADAQIQADYEDVNALKSFADAIDVATIEFENIPVPSLEQIEKHVPTRPGASVLRTIKNRRDEKQFLSGHGFPVAPFRVVCGKEDLADIANSAFPAVLKTCSSGYDGKGQQLVNSADQLLSAWTALGEVECVLESFVDFDCEFSVIVARNEQAMAHYQPIRNDHQNHILDVSSSPSHLPQKVCEEATKVTCAVAEALQYVGVMCVEFFLRRDGAIVINEIAPRPHNSGHLTIEAHATSQFEQQVRAVCNLPLGSVTQLRPAAMANLLGDIWNDGVPRWQNALAAPGTNLHLYAKDLPNAGRKMGHLTCLSDTAESAIAQVKKTRRELNAGAASNSESNSDLIGSDACTKS